MRCARRCIPSLTACVVLLVAGQQLTSAQNKLSEENAAPVILKQTSENKIGVPPFSFFDQPQCDDDGDVFFHLSSGSYRVARIFELTTDTDKSVLYKLPPDLAQYVAFEDFAVSPSGELYVLGQAKEGSEDSDVHQYVFRFSDSDGSMTDKVRLETPSPYLIGDTFTVLESGGFLFAGRFVKGATEPGKRYSALFDSSGRMMKNLDAQGKIVGAAVAGTAATRGKNGYAYLVSQGEVLEIPPGGDPIRRIPFTNPDPGADPAGIQVSQGLISITLSKANKEGQIEPRYLLLDAVTGAVHGYYEPSGELGNEMLCFSRKTGYTFLHRTKDGNSLQVITAALR